MELTCEYLPATEGARQELVLLHGWGCNREIWRSMLAGLRPWANIRLFDLPGCAPGCGTDAAVDLDRLLETILASCPPVAVYVGWSLGGQLAVNMAVREPQRVAALVTLCSNPRFVATPDWPGMPAKDFTAFQAGYHVDPAAGLRRFDSLQTSGSTRHRSLVRQLQRCRAHPPGVELRTGLAWLAQWDQREQLRRLCVPQLHLLAERDGLVPGADLAASLETLLEANAGAEVGQLAGASHVVPLDSAPEAADRIKSFVEHRGLLAGPLVAPAMPAKQDIAASFSRAACRYDSVAGLQRAVGQRLLERLQPGMPGPMTVLDLGCGTGSFQPALRGRYPQSCHIGLDLAPGMVRYARARLDRDGLWLVADAEALPLAAGSVDLVFSSLAFQWCHQPEKLFAELARVLAPRGRCFFTSLGPETLRELRSAWAAVDAHQHVNRFLPVAELEAAARRVPGMCLSLATWYHRMEYSRVGELLNELKTLGAHNMNRDRPAGLTSRRTLQGMLAAYEAQREDGLLPATYEVIFGEVQRL